MLSLCNDTFEKCQISVELAVLLYHVNLHLSLSDGDGDLIGNHFSGYQQGSLESIIDIKQMTSALPIGDTGLRVYVHLAGGYLVYIVYITHHSLHTMYMCIIMFYLIYIYE